MLEHIDLKKTYGYGFRYTLNPNTDVLTIFCSEERLNEYDFEYGLCHELIEATLRLIVKELENHWKPDGDEEGTEAFHASATLSLPRYDLIAHYHDYLETELEKGVRNNISKL